MTIIVILLLFICVPLLIVWLAKYKNKRDTISRREKFTPIIEQRYSEVTGSIREEYPLIEFHFPTVESLINNCQLFQYGLPTLNYVQDALRPLIYHAKDAFLNAPSSLNNEKTTDAKELAIQKGIGDKDFWATELKHRTTRSGGLPSDWSTRRKVVYSRDNGRCRRCGLIVHLEDCHVHHLVRKSQGGMHSFDNLVTICRDCHALMPEHEGMKADIYYKSIGERVYYYVSKTGTIHQEYCQHADDAKKVRDLYTRLIERGLKPCKKCKPGEVHDDGVKLWTPEIVRFVEENIGIYRERYNILNALYSQ